MRARFSHFTLIFGTLLFLQMAEGQTRAARAPRATAVESEPVSTKRVPKSVGQTSRQSTVVVIDAGHGGFDRGGIPRQRVAEKTMTLDVAQRLGAILEAGGYRVIMTRNSDVFVPLGTRTAIANSYRNAIFVSVHFNSAPRRGADGIETYFYSRESLPLASAIHYYVSRGAASPNRGVRRRGYFVLRRTRVPAVLVECGFLTNPRESQYIQNSGYRQKLAENIARGIRERSGVASTSRVASAGAVPLQPFIDQTRVSSRKSSKKSKRNPAKSKKSSEPSESSSKKKKTTGGESSKKKSTSQKSED